MGRQLFQDGPYIDTHVASGAALVATGAEALWIGATFTPIFANDPNNPAWGSSISRHVPFTKRRRN